MSDQSAQNAGGAPPSKELTGRIGKYEILKPLGKGAMGMVYLAHDTILERDVALKVMVAQIADDVELNQRFIREAKAVAKMTHPNVVQVFDLGNHTDGSPFIAMELLKGQDLQHAMRSHPPMPLDRKVGIILQVLAGLAHAHQAGIVHRDIKPANIFVNHDGSVKIMDFGVARLTSGSMTGTGNIVGTADYMSPEQVKGAKVDGRSDLFSVGCMLYELCAGKRPFHSDNLMAIFYKITHEEPNFDLIPEGEDYDALLPTLRKALAKDLEGRYQNAFDFAVDLKEYLRRQGAGSDEHALADLVDVEGGGGRVPEPAEDAAGPTLITDDVMSPVSGATVDLPGTQARRPGTGSGTRRMAAGPTVVTAATAPGGARPGTSPRTQVRGTMAPTVVQTPAAHPPRPVHVPPPSSGTPILYVAVGGLAVALLVAGGYIAFREMKGKKDEPPVTQASLPPATTLAPPVTAAPATTLPPTVAPPPTFAEAVGKGAAAMKAAQRAFTNGDYGRAVSEAQAALREDPQNRPARQMIDQAEKGQQAQAKLRSAQAALGRKDWAQAIADANAARDLAPWESGASDVIGRAQRGQQQAQEDLENARRGQLATQVNGLLSQADQQLQGQKWDAAVALYDEALKLDPNNQRAALGRTSAIAGKAVATSGGGGGTRPAGRSFTVGKTTAQASADRGSNTPAGFEETPGLVVKKGTSAADLPGKLGFDVDPQSPQPGQRYSVKVYLTNEGNAPIQIAQMVVTTTINGKRVSAPVPPQAKDAAPGQKTMLASIGPDTWKEDTSDWSMEVQVRTTRGEKYTNAVSWK
jgi:hypothetical protein